MLNEIIIHKIKLDGNDPEMKNLVKQQRVRPIKTSEVVSPTGIITLDKYKTRLLNTTIDFSWLLKPAYCSYYQLDQKLIDYLSMINEQRNMLHYCTSAKWAINIKSMKELISIVQCDMAVLQNTIIEKIDPKFDPNFKVKLKPKCS